MTTKKHKSLIRRTKRKKKSRTKKNKIGGKSSILLDSLIGVPEKRIDDNFTGSSNDLECYRRKFSNIQHCIQQDCVQKIVGNTKLESGEETKMMELEKENKKLKKEIRKLKLLYEGLELHGHLFCKSKKINPDVSST
tara:strand:+ start:16 stop:426 length:411 start_codon:yes stop_codon:yes gene_type:complete